MTPDRPLQLLRFALENRDVPLAIALARVLGARADVCLRDMPRIRGSFGQRRLLSAALEALAAR